MPKHSLSEANVMPETIHTPSWRFDPEHLTRNAIAKCFDCNLEEVNSEEVPLIKRRLKLLRDALIAEGSLEPENIDFHEVMHAAAATERNNQKGVTSSLPAFLKPNGKINNEEALREELVALLFPLREGGHSAFTHLLGLSGLPGTLSFEDAVKKYHEEQSIGARAQTKKDLDALEPAASDQYKEDELKIFSALWEKIQATPDTGFLRRTQRIYDGWRAGRKRVLLDEFILMTNPPSS